MSLINGKAEMDARTPTPVEAAETTGQDKGGDGGKLPPLNHNGTASAGDALHPLPQEMVDALLAPLPAEALKPHPTKDYLSSVKAIYVIERLNQVFGTGGWTYATSVVEAPPPTLVPDDKRPGTMREKPGMIVMHVVLKVPAYGICLEQYGGSDNMDRGDAYKGAVTDALSKIASYLGIAIDVYKGGGPTRQNPRGMAVAQPKPPAPALHTQAAADKVAQDKIAAGAALQRASKPQLDPQPAPWSTRGTMREYFGRIRERVGETVYLAALDNFGAIGGRTSPLNWPDEATALRCYHHLIELACEVA